MVEVVHRVVAIAYLEVVAAIGLPEEHTLVVAGMVCRAAEPIARSEAMVVVVDHSIVELVHSLLVAAA